LADTLDNLFDDSKARRFSDLSEQELLRREFTTSDPESLPGVSDDPPPDEPPEVECSYDMTGRGEKVRCVYCKHPNHFKGIVVRYPSGARRLVGRDCALIHHGIQFAQQLNEFDAGAERQGYIRRRLALIAASGQVFNGFNELRSDPAVVEHDRVLRDLRELFPDLAAGLANAARRDERLAVDRVVRDEEGEKARRARLGERFEEERQKVKAAGKQWQMFKHVFDDIGPLDGAMFFASGISLKKRLDEIQGAVQKVFRTLSGDDLTTAQIRNGLRRLGDLREELADEFDRLDALAAAFAPDNVLRIVRWANEQVADQIRREALQEQRKPGPISNRFASEGQSIRELKGRWGNTTVSLPNVYRPPKRTLLDTLKQATSADREVYATRISHDCSATTLAIIDGSHSIHRSMAAFTASDGVPPAPWWMPRIEGA
jgi:hypothetical protein